MDAGRRNNLLPTPLCFPSTRQQASLHPIQIALEELVCGEGSRVTQPRVCLAHISYTSPPTPRLYAPSTRNQETKTQPRRHYQPCVPTGVSCGTKSQGLSSIPYLPFPSLGAVDLAHRTHRRGSYSRTQGDSSPCIISQYLYPSPFLHTGSHCAWALKIFWFAEVFLD